MARERTVLVVHVRQKEEEHPTSDHGKGQPMPGEQCERAVNENLAKVVGITRSREQPVLDQALA